MIRFDFRPLTSRNWSRAARDPVHHHPVHPPFPILSSAIGKLSKFQLILFFIRIVGLASELARKIDSWRIIA
jgi:hypothetical protein